MLKKFWKLVGTVVVCELVGVGGAMFTGPVVGSEWYAALAKPFLQPPGWIFGPVWTVLYCLMGVALYLVWARGWRVERQGVQAEGRGWNKYSEKFWAGPWQRANVISIFAIQLFLNGLWSVIFFGLKMPGLAFFDLLALWVAILYTIVNFYRISKTAAYLLIPYLLWVSFAGYLNFSIWLLNY